ncbi:MAG: tetratricopeptide repeat protein [Candidatus Aureabacteria bacterium]|nr:tetratricopeptide repeat protein [Candidatus Auribacterota bacterium]
MIPNRFQTYRFHILLALIFIIPVFYIEPLLFGVELPDAFSFPKHYVIQFSALLIFLLFCFELVIRRELRFAWGKGMLPLSLLIVWSFISLLYTPGFHIGVRECGRWCSIWMIFFSAMNDCTSGKGVAQLARSACISASIVSSIALLQFFGFDFSFRRGILHKVYSTLGNPNYIASYLAVVLPLGYFGWIYPAATRRAAASFLVFSIAGTAALFATGSRGGIAALLLGVFIVARLLRLPLKRFKPYALILVIAALFVFLYLPSPLNHYSMAAVGKISDIASTTRAGTAWRVMVWEIGAGMALEHPFRGSGIGSLNILYLPHLARFLNQREHKNFLPLAGEGIDYAHQEYLQVWIELGFIGLLLLLWFIVSIVASGFTMTREARDRSGMPAALCAGCSAFLIEGMVSFPLHLWASTVTFSIFAGILASRHSTVKTIRISRPASRVAVALSSSALFAVLLLSSIRTVISEAYCGRGMREFHAGRIASALGELTAAIRWQPQNGRARSFRGICLAKDKRYAEALQEMHAALTTYNHPALYLEIAELYLALGDKADAAHFISAAVSTRPLDSAAWLEKGSLLYNSGNLTGAADCYAHALRIKPDSPEAARNLAVAYQAMGKLEDSFRMYERAVELGVENADVYANMGSIRALRGENDRARSLWLKALAIDPHNRNARENLRRLDGER